MPSMRQYASVQSVSQITGIPASDITDQIISQAESMIDDVCAEFYQGSFAKSMNRSLTLNQANFTANSLVIEGSYSDNYFNYTVVELLSGHKKGVIIPVVSSVGNTLHYDTQDLSGQFPCKIYQLGKFPMVKDTTTFKSIPREVVEAVAWQVEFILKKGKKLNKKGVKSESIGESYSYTLADNKEDNIYNRISPLALDKISVYAIQTL